MYATYTAEMGVDSAEDRETILAQIYELFNPESDGHKKDNMEGTTALYYVRHAYRLVIEKVCLAIQFVRLPYCMKHTQRRKNLSHHMVTS